MKCLIRAEFARKTYAEDGSGVGNHRIHKIWVGLERKG